MKILWIISSGWKEGGAENYLVLLRPVLEARGHVVKILASDDRPDMPHFSDYHFKAHTGIFQPIFHAFNPSACVTLKKVLKEFQPDIVHIHTVGHASPAILYPLKHHPTVLTVHGPESFVTSLRLWCFPSSYFRDGNYKKENLLFLGKLRLAYHRLITDPLYALGFPNIDTTIAPSSYIQDMLMEDGHTSDYVPNGTELFAHHPISPEEIGHRIVYAGRLERYKGVDVLLRALARVRERFPDVRLSIAGDGSQRGALEGDARSLGITDAVEFLGHLDRAAVEGLYARAVCAVMPSVWVEAFGLSGVEAMSVGRPVIASRVGGIPDWLIDGDTGYLVPPADSDALADAIIRLLSDPRRLKEMMAKARAQAERFSMGTHADALLLSYEDTVRRKSKMV